MRVMKAIGLAFLIAVLLPGLAQAEVPWKLRSETSIPLRVADYCMASYAPNGKPSFRLARNSLGQMAMLFTPDEPSAWRVAASQPIQILVAGKLIRQAGITLAANGEVNMALGREEKWLSELGEKQALTLRAGSGKDSTAQEFKLPNMTSVTGQLRACIASAWSQQPDVGGLPSDIEPVLHTASWVDAHILLDKTVADKETYLIKSQNTYVRLSNQRSHESLDTLLLNRVDPLEPQCRGYFQSTLGLPVDYPDGTAVKAELACHFQGDPTRAWLLLYEPKGSGKVWEFFIEAPETNSDEAIELVKRLETAFGQEN